MSSGWFVFVVVTGVVIFTGVVLAVAILRASWAQRERESLTSADLTALEESAVLLIEQLKTEADAAANELDEKCASLKALIAEADRKLEALKSLTVQPINLGGADVSTAIVEDGRSPRDRVLELAATGLASADIARLTGVDCAEVKLILSLQKVPSN